MAKIGRNDPCPCGSGKKHKACCLGRSTSTKLVKGFQASRERAEEIAARWLGTEEDENAPLKDARGAKLTMVMDRFELTEPGAVTQVRQLGRIEGETVLFFDQDRWIGEADFSIPGQMTMLSVGESLADRLCALMKPIVGLTFQERQIDRLDGLQSKPAAASGLLDFKRQFFAAWPDEENQKLEGVTPREASRSHALRPKLLRLLNDLEAKEKVLPAKERFSFTELRRALGLSG